MRCHRLPRARGRWPRSGRMRSPRSGKCPDIASLREGAEMPPSLREVARRVSCKRRHGGGECGEGRTPSVSLRSTAPSEREPKASLFEGCGTARLMQAPSRRGRMRRGEDSLSLASLDSSLREGASKPSPRSRKCPDIASLREGAEMPPSLREVARRVSCKRHDGGGRMRRGEDSLSHAMLDSSLREGAKSLPL